MVLARIKEDGHVNVPVFFSLCSMIKKIIRLVVGIERFDLVRFIKISLLSACPIILVHLVLSATYQQRLPMEIIPDWNIGNAAVNNFMGLLDVLILSPFIETCLLLVFSCLFKKQSLKHPLPFVFANVVVWVASHVNHLGGYIGLLSAWSGLIFTVALYYRKNLSINRICMYVAFIHSAHNLIAVFYAIIASSYLHS